jgi:hypothetical protein
MGTMQPRDLLGRYRSSSRWFAHCIPRESKSSKLKSTLVFEPMPEVRLLAGNAPAL